MSVEAKQIAITSPCPITLDRSGIAPADKAMFCAHCTKDVHLLSQMTESEARDLMRQEAGQDICVSYAIRQDGSIRFRPEPKLIPANNLTRRSVPTPPARQVPAPRRRMSLVATIGASLLLAACTPHNPADEVVGEVAVQPVDQPELVEQVPCEEPMPAGGLRAEPLPEPEPEMLVDGGMRAEPLPEPVAEPESKEPEPQAKVDEAKPPKERWKGRKRGGIRAHPIGSDDPLAGI